MINNIKLCFLGLIAALSLWACGKSEQTSSEIDKLSFSGTIQQQEQTCSAIAAAKPENSAVDYVGNIWREEVESDSDYLTYWDQVSPENAGKWGQVETNKDTMLWQRLDTATALATNNDLSFKFHTLIWGGNQPAWLSTLTPEQQLIELEQWMNAIAERYPNMQQIDVVNEPLHSTPPYKNALTLIESDNTTATPNEWSWVVNSYARARELFPQSELLLNDFNIISSDDNTTSYLEIITLLQQENLIDGIGIQAHFLETANLERVERNLQRLGETGLPVYVSEFDLDISDDQQQMDRMNSLFPLFYTSPFVKGITFWGFRENQIWQANAHLINADGTKRPAFKWLECYLALGK